MISFNQVRLSAFASSLALLASFPVSALDIQPIGEIQIGQGEGYAEMLRYHAASQSLVVTASETGTIERISIATPLLTELDPQWLYLTHIGHDLENFLITNPLPEDGRIHIARDGMTLNID